MKEKKRIRPNNLRQGSQDCPASTVTVRTSFKTNGPRDAVLVYNECEPISIDYRRSCAAARRLSETRISDALTITTSGKNNIRSAGELDTWKPAEVQAWLDSVLSSREELPKDFNWLLLVNTPRSWRAGLTILNGRV
jgi:hypothetical protein